MNLLTALSATSVNPLPSLNKMLFEELNTIEMEISNLFIDQNAAAQLTQMLTEVAADFSKQIASADDAADKEWFTKNQNLVFRLINFVSAAYCHFDEMHEILKNIEPVNQTNETGAVA